MISGNTSLKNRRCTVSILIVLSGIILSCITAFFGYDILPDYQDKLVHLRRIAALADTLKSGYFPARIYFAMNQGTGYAMPVFYPDINLYLPSILYLLGIPLGVVYASYVVVTNVLTAVISYSCIKGFLDCIKPGEKTGCGSGACISAAVASFIYTLSIYRLTNVYIRDAAGEYTAMAILPLVIYGFARIYTYAPKGKSSVVETVRTALPLGLGMALLVCTHILTTMVTVGALLLTAIVYLRKTVDRKVLGCLVTAALIFLGLSAFVVVPMIDYMMSDTYLVSGSSYIMRGFYPGWRELLELIPSGSGSGIAYELRMPTAVGASLTAILAAWAVRKAVELTMYFRKGKSGAGHSAAGSAEVYLFVLSAVFLFVSSKYFPWTYIESAHNLLTVLMCSIQFSWRYIGIATVLIVFLGATLISDVLTSNTKLGRGLSVLLILLALLPAIILEIRACTENRHAVIRSGSEIGIVSDELYFPVSWNREAVYDRVPIAYGDTVIEEFNINDHRWNVEVTSDAGAGSVAFPVVYYKGYESVSEDGRRFETVQGDDGRVVTLIPAGFSGSFVMRFSENIPWRLSELLTLVTVVLLCIVMCLCGKPVSSRRSKAAEVPPSE